MADTADWTSATRTLLTDRRTTTHNGIPVALRQSGRGAERCPAAARSLPSGSREGEEMAEFEVEGTTFLNWNIRVQAHNEGEAREEAQRIAGRIDVPSSLARSTWPSTSFGDPESRTPGSDHGPGALLRGSGHVGRAGHRARLHAVRERSPRHTPGQPHVPSMRSGEGLCPASAGTRLPDGRVSYRQGVPDDESTEPPTPEQKAALLRRHHVEKVPVSTICDEEELQPSVFYDWQRELFERAATCWATPRRAARAVASRSWRRRSRRSRPSWRGRTR